MCKIFSFFDESKPASERTTFQIAYDDGAIYFAIRCFVLKTTLIPLLSRLFQMPWQSHELTEGARELINSGAHSFSPSEAANVVESLMHPGLLEKQNTGPLSNKWHSLSN